MANSVVIWDHDNSSTDLNPPNLHQYAKRGCGRIIEQQNDAQTSRMRQLPTATITLSTYKTIVLDVSNVFDNVHLHVHIFSNDLNSEKKIP
jgi:hypothetical protein